VSSSITESPTFTYGDASMGPTVDEIGRLILPSTIRARHRRCLQIALQTIRWLIAHQAMIVALSI